MKPMESFLMLYSLLDQCYDIDHGDDGDNVMVLGSFLGDIDPTFWDDGYPMDQAVYQDWFLQNDVSKLDQENIIPSVLRFLEFYEDRGFYFGRTAELLQGPQSSEMLKSAAEFSRWMYQKHNYPD